MRDDINISRGLITSIIYVCIDTKYIRMLRTFRIGKDR